MRLNPSNLIIIVSSIAVGTFLGIGLSKTHNNSAQQGIANATGRGSIAHPPEQAPQAGSVGQNVSSGIAIPDLEAAFQVAMTERNAKRREDALDRLGDKITASDIQPALKMLIKHKEPEAPLLVDRLLRRWARTDPSAGIVFARSVQVVARRNQYVKTVLIEWATDSPIRALEWVNHLPPGREHDGDLAVVFDVSAEQNPQQALALLAAMKTVSNRNSLQGLILRRWARSDPQAAAKSAATMTGLDPKTIGNLAYLLALKDPNAALIWARSIASQQNRNSALESTLQAWATIAPRDAAAFALSQTNGNYFMNPMLYSVARQWASSDPGAAYDWAKNLPVGPHRDKCLQTIVEQLAQSDPVTSASYALMLPSGDDQQRTLARIADEWYQIDADGAISWLKQLPVSVQGHVAETVIARLLNEDPAQAADLVATFSDGSVRNQLTGELASEWAQKDMSGAVSWLTSLPDSQEREYALRRMGPLWAKEDPNAAAEFAQKLPGNESTDDFVRLIAVDWGVRNPQEALGWMQTMGAADPSKVLSEIVTGWATRSPRDAAAYVVQLPGGPAQDAAAVAVIAQWSSSDPTGVADWVGRFPNGSLRDTAINAVGTQWALRDPSASMAWLESVSATAEIQARVADIWLRSDKVAATSWIQNASLPLETKQRLLRIGK